MRSRVLSVLGRRTKATLPELPYEYHALEPYISADIMELHHSKFREVRGAHYGSAIFQMTNCDNSSAGISLQSFTA